MRNAGGLTQMELLKLGKQLREETVVGQELGLHAHVARDGELARLFRSHQARQQRHVQVLQSNVERAGAPAQARRPGPAAGPGPGMATAATCGGHTGPAYS